MRPKPTLPHQPGPGRLLARLAAPALAGALIWLQGGCLQPGAFGAPPAPGPDASGAGETSFRPALVSPALIRTWLDNGRKDDAGRPIVALAVYHNDLQAGRDSYTEVGHVPGAYKASLVDDANLEDPAPGHLSQTRSDGVIKVYGLVADGAHADAFARRFGIGPGTTVVLTGESMIASARAFWALRYWGFPREQLRVMDGTIEAWRKAGFTVETGSQPLPAPSTFSFMGLTRQTSLRAPLSEVFAAIGDPHVSLLDGRTPKEYAGQATTGGGMFDSALAGHIRGALSLPYTDLLGDSAAGNPVKGKEALAEILRARGLDPERDRDRRILVNCRTGVRASALFLVLTEALGFRNVAVYDGSWEEWGQLTSDRSLPAGDPLNHLGAATAHAADSADRTEALTLNSSAAKVLVPAVGGPVPWFPGMVVAPAVPVPDRVNVEDASYGTSATTPSGNGVSSVQGGTPAPAAQGSPAATVAPDPGPPEPSPMPPDDSCV